MQHFGLTNIGKVRKLNEDGFFIHTNPYFCVVADGMGGHNAGEVAAQGAIDTVVQSLRSLEAISPIEMRQAMAAANRAVFSLSGQSEEMSGMGTTLVLCCPDTQMVCVANIGDSRAYYYNSRDRHLIRITRDHSVVEELIASGSLTEQKAKSYPFRNVITRAVGTSEKVNADLFDVTWQEDDYILLCTDGLCGYVEDEQIEQAFAQQAEPERIANQLLTYALDQGGRDNITIIVLKNASGEVRHE